MLKVFVVGGDSIGRTLVCRGGEVVGRAPECALRVAERSVSREHARIERDGDGWRIVDLGSRNGLFVAGQRVEEAEIVDGLEVTVGELPLRFRLEGGDDAAPRESSSAPAGARPSAVVAPVPPAVARPVRAVSEEDELVLEEDEDLDRVLVDSAREAPRRERTAAARETTLRGAEERRREILERGSDGGGFLGGDLAQRPLWVQALVGLFLLAAFGAIVWGARWAVMSLRGG